MPTSREHGTNPRATGSNPRALDRMSRIEQQLDRIEQLVLELAGKAQPMVAVVDERGRFMPGTGWIGSGQQQRHDETQLELDPDPEPLSAYDALTAMRRTLRPTDGARP